MKMIKNKKSISWFYIPNLTTHLNLTMTKWCIEHALSEIEKPTAKDDFQAFYGLWDSAKTNQNYCELITMGDDIDIRPSTIWSILEIEQSETIKTSINGLSELEEIYDNNIKDLELNSCVLFDFIHNRRSYQYIYNAYGVTLIQMKRLIRKHYAKIKAIKRNNRKYLNNKRKVNEEWIEKIKNFINAHKYKHFTLKNIKAYLEANTEDFDKITIQTISKAQKLKLKFMYKRISTAHKNFSNPDIKTKILTNIAVIDELQNSGYSIVYMDEFRFTTKSSKYFGWVNREEPGYIKTYINDFEINAIIGFSNQGIHGIILNTEKMMQKYLDTFTTNSVQIWTISM